MGFSQHPAALGGSSATPQWAAPPALPTPLVPHSRLSPQARVLSCSHPQRAPFKSCMAMALLWGLSSFSTAPPATRWWAPASSPVPGRGASPTGLQGPPCASVRPSSLLSRPEWGPAARGTSQAGSVLGSCCPRGVWPGSGLEAPQTPHVQRGRQS